jgi:uncharacterized protein YdeI (YjbR/CyaY-like superfamily)
MAKKKTTEEKGLGMIYKADQWAEELDLLYSIIRKTELVEETKWGGPCFTLNGKNVLGLGGFKTYVGIWFHQGVFLKDPKKVLVNASEGKTKALRQWRFQSKKEIDAKLVTQYIEEAISNARTGKELKPEKKENVKVPAELEILLKKNKKAKSIFESLTPFKQREYNDYISEAKQEKTRLSRAEKSLELILQGKGLNDKYR